MWGPKRLVKLTRVLEDGGAWWRVAAEGGGLWWKKGWLEGGVTGINLKFEEYLS